MELAGGWAAAEAGAEAAEAGHQEAAADLCGAVRQLPDASAPAPWVCLEGATRQARAAAMLLTALAWSGTANCKACITKLVDSVAGAYKRAGREGLWMGSLHTT